jgi:hypothetical protein
MDTLGLLLLAWLAVFLINLVPALMPPTWSVLALFLVQFDVPLLPLAVGGAVAATAGRVALALGTRWAGAHVIPPRWVGNLRDLGAALRAHPRWLGSGVLLYSFGPIPSNQLFMAVGLAGVDLRVVAGAFFVGRVLSYTFFAYTASRAVESFSDLFLRMFHDPSALLVEGLSLGILIVLAIVPWGRLLGRLAGSPPVEERGTH